MTKSKEQKKKGFLHKAGKFASSWIIRIIGMIFIGGK
jgi:hypothetical protein